MSFIDLRICQAKRDVQLETNKYGKTVVLYLRDESKVTRDKYNSVISQTWTAKHTLKAFPYQTNPSEKQLEKAGIFEKVDAIAWFAIKDFEDKGIGETDILIDDATDIVRSTVTVDGGSYTIKQKNLASPLGDNYLYIVLGLNKK